MADKKVLFELADGPEGITIYSSDKEAVVDWANHIPALYVTVALDGAFAKFGPFKLLKPPAVPVAPEATPEHKPWCNFWAARKFGSGAVSK